MVIGGFHLFELEPGAPEAERLIALTAEELSRGESVYYTGHCTGEWAFRQLAGRLEGRLREMSGGTMVVV